MADSYHHGDLRSALLVSAATMVVTRGAANLSLRELAREAGVSHAAPAHHFGDRRGLFTALATQGFGLLADALDASHPDFHAAALAYVKFALAHPGHYAVMFEPTLIDPQDAALRDAESRASEALRAGVATLTPSQRGSDPDTAALAAWSLVHGFVTLWGSGAARSGDDPLDLTSKLAYTLFPLRGEKPR